MILFNGLIGFLCLILWPASLPLMILLTFSLTCLFNNFFVFPMLVKHIAIPVENNEAEIEPIFKDRH
jgi:hypothetical protein